MFFASPLFRPGWFPFVVAEAVSLEKIPRWQAVKMAYGFSRSIETETKHEKGCQTAAEEPTRFDRKSNDEVFYDGKLSPVGEKN